MLDVTIAQGYNSGFGCAPRYTGVTCIDCKTVSWCYFGREVQERRKNCSVFGGFCDPEITSCVDYNTCSGNRCSAQTMICIYEGYFPNPDECNSYFYCSENSAWLNLLASKFQCPPGMVYDIVFETCVGNGPGNTVWCNVCKDGEVDDFWRYQHELDDPRINKGYYVACSQNQYALFSCANRYEIFNISLIACEFKKCPYKGLFQHENRSLYYICDDLEESPKVRKCQRGMIFSPNFQKCVPGRNGC